MSVEARLRELVRERGPIPFAAFMEEALYGEGGYYAAERTPIGEEGDFITGSSVSPLFGVATATVLRRLDGALDRPAELFEAGCGDGRHLAAVAAASPSGRRLRGWDRVRRPLPAGVEAVGAPDDIGAGEIEGMVFSYELFDALPVHRILGRPGGEPGELHVGLGEDGEWCWVEGELSSPELAGLLGEATLEVGQVADLAPAAAPLYRRLAALLGRGLIVTFDYGYERQALLDPRVRRWGTLACHRRHRVHRNPFVAVGQQDLTAHVDFSALIAAGESLGLETVTLTRQARWLTASGLFEELSGADQARRRDALTLLDPEGMGEEIRVLVQARDVDVKRLFDAEILG